MKADAHSRHAESLERAIPTWLDLATTGLVEDTVRLLVKRHANILLAVILFGSVAAMKSARLMTPTQVMWTF